MNKPFLNFVYFSITAASIVTLDQLIKSKIRQEGGFYVCNQGISFSLNLSPFVFWLTFGIFLLVLAAWYLYFDKRYPVSFFFPLGLGLLMGGALSNGLDRLWFGCVLDYISFLGKILPTFNLADVGIFLGSCLIFYPVLIQNQFSGE